MRAWRGGSATLGAPRGLARARSRRLACIALVARRGWLAASAPPCVGAACRRSPGTCSRWRWAATSLGQHLLVLVVQPWHTLVASCFTVSLDSTRLACELLASMLALSLNKWDAFAAASRARPVSTTVVAVPHLRLVLERCEDLLRSAVCPCRSYVTIAVFLVLCPVSSTELVFFLRIAVVSRSACFALSWRISPPTACLRRLPVLPVPIA